MEYEFAPNPPKWEMVCELCYPKAVEIGEIIPGGWLFENDGKYAIMTTEGHKDHEILFFPDKPTPDPDPDCTIEDDHPDFKASEDWLEKVLAWSETIKLRPERGYFLVKNSIEAGCEGFNVLLWLYDRAGKMIQEHGQVAQDSAGSTTIPEVAQRVEGSSG